MADAGRPIDRVLIVEDDAMLRSALRRTLRSRGAHRIEEAATLAAGQLLLPAGFDLVVLDVRLPDGSGVALAEAAAALQPAPLIIVLSGEASPAEAFRLAQLGVLKFVAKPISLDNLVEAVAFVQDARQRIEVIAKACVGSTDMREVQYGVRQAMVRQALAMSKGTKLPNS
jgi:DNA-binding NtrC family response regulator